MAAESANTPVGDSSDDENGDYMRVVDVEGGRPSRSIARSAGPSGLATPGPNSRDESLRPNNKRPVIDLTVSDDEDETPPRPVKRSNATQTPNSFASADVSALNGYASVGPPRPIFDYPIFMR